MEGMEERNLHGYLPTLSTFSIPFHSFPFLFVLNCFFGVGIEKKWHIFLFTIGCSDASGLMKRGFLLCGGERDILRI